jgi:hypothetical protein
MMSRGPVPREHVVLTHCVKHTFESPEGECRVCGNTYCQRCLVFPFGPNKPPYCVACAIEASGVRMNARARPAPPTPGSAVAAAAPPPPPPLAPGTAVSEDAPADRRSLWARRKAERQAAKAGASTLPPPPPPPPSGAIPPIDVTASAGHHQL